MVQCNQWIVSYVTVAFVLLGLGVLLLMPHCHRRCSYIVIALFLFFFCVFVRLFWVGSFPRFCTSYRCVLVYCMNLWAAVTATVFTADDFNSYRNVTIF